MQFEIKKMLTKKVKRTFFSWFIVISVFFELCPADANLIPELPSLQFRLPDATQVPDQPSLHDKLRNASFKNRNLHDYKNWLVTYHRNRLPRADIRNLQAITMKMYMNTSADPCEDFYEYSCGNWKNYNSIPDTQSTYDNFQKLNDIILMSEIDSLLKPYTRYHKKQKYLNRAHSLYRSCVNLDQSRIVGVQPLLKFIDSLGGWPVLDSNWNPKYFDWVNVTARLNIVGMDLFIAATVLPDPKKSDKILQYLGQMTFWPNENVFLNRSKILNHLTEFRASVMEILGVCQEVAISVAREITEFEANLAYLTVPMKASGNAVARLEVQALHLGVPEIDWTKFLTIVQGDVVDPNQLIIVAIDYVNKLVELLSRTEPRTIANFLMMKVTESYSMYLDDRFDEARLKFLYSYTGITEQIPLWFRCLDQVDKVFGLLFGSLFVRNYFNAFMTADVTALTRKISREFHNTLDITTWLDKRTKEYAIKKASTLDIQVGYPDNHMEYDKELKMIFKGLNISSTEYFENMLNIAIFEFKRKQSKLGKKPDRSEWKIYPHKVNAYYRPSANQLVIPAGILQPPFYHTDYPKALKFGGIGFLIGHEITHGFDSLGSKFDIDGNIRNWWSYESLAVFQEKLKCFVDQYNNYSIKGYTVNGGNSKGENVADNGGLNTAFKAYSRWLDENANTAAIRNEILPGLDLTSKQLFFLSASQVLCGTVRTKFLEIFSKLNHVPKQSRVMGMISNSEDFSREFNCPLGSKMNPIKKCKIW